MEALEHFTILRHWSGNLEIMRDVDLRVDLGGTIIWSGNATDANTACWAALDRMSIPLTPAADWTQLQIDEFRAYFTRAVNGEAFSNRSCLLA